MTEETLRQFKRRISKLTNEEQLHELVDELIRLWTGKNAMEWARIQRETSKGSDWRQKLVDESRNHMLDISAKMTDSYVRGSLNDTRTIGYLATRLGDLLYEEQQTRKAGGIKK
jgi:hypothetical protein